MILSTYQRIHRGLVPFEIRHDDEPGLGVFVHVQYSVGLLDSVEDVVYPGVSGILTASVVYVWSLDVNADGGSTTVAMN